MGCMGHIQVSSYSAHGLLVLYVGAKKGQGALETGQISLHNVHIMNYQHCNDYITSHSTFLKHRKVY